MTSISKSLYSNQHFILSIQKKMLETLAVTHPNQLDRRQFVLDAIERARSNPTSFTHKTTASINVFYAGHKFPADRVLFSETNDFNLFQEIPSLSNHRYFLSSVDLTNTVNQMDNAWCEVIKNRRGTLIDVITEYAQEMWVAPSSYNFYQWLIVNHSTISANSLDNNSLLNNEFKQEVIKTFGELPDESIIVLYRNTLDLYITLNYSDEVFIMRSLQQDFLEWFIELFKAIQTSDINYEGHSRAFMRLMIADKDRSNAYYEKMKQERCATTANQNDTYESNLDFEDWYLLKHSPDTVIYKDPYTREELTPKKLCDMTKYDLVFGKGVKDYSRGNKISYRRMLKEYDYSIKDNCLYSFRAFMCAKSRDAERLMNYLDPVRSNYGFTNIAQYLETVKTPITYSELFNHFTSIPPQINDESTNTSTPDSTRN